jgi:TRAP-type mannitol/chloroaromatic compound transport system permease small subunit
MNTLKQIYSGIDSFTEVVGRAVSYLILVLIFIMVYEVLARYLFNAPTKWAYDLSYMVGGTGMLLGAGYSMLHNVHVRIDVFYGKFSMRRQRLIDTIGSIVFALPMITILTQDAWKEAIRVFVQGTRSDYGIWMPVLWPYRTAMAIAFVLFLLAAISFLIKSLLSIKTGEDLMGKVEEL